MAAPRLKLIQPKGADEARGAAAGPDYARLSIVEREFLPRLLELQETPPSPFARKLLWTIVAVIAALIVWSVMGKVDVVTNAPGRIIPDGRVKVIQPVETAIVKAIHVKEGQRVKAGDLMIELDPALSVADSESASERYELSRAAQARLLSELRGIAPRYPNDTEPETVALQEALRLARVAAYETRSNAARLAVEERESALGASEAQLRKADANLEIAVERERKMATLAASGFISRMEHLRHLQELQAAQYEQQALTKSVEQVRSARAQALEQVRVLEQERRASVLAEIDRDRVAQPNLKRDKDKTSRLKELKWLRSPVDGYVQAIGVTTIGAVVTPAQSLVTIVPQDTPLLIEASVSNEDIGYVRIGQAVDVKVDTYPFQKYGVLSGALIWLSPDAEPLEGGEQAQAKRGPTGPYVYRAHIKLAPDAQLSVGTRPAELQPGMTVQADIKTDRRRVIEFFLLPLIKNLDEGIKVR